MTSRVRLKVATLNVHWFGAPKRLDRLVDLIEEHDLDVVCLQESNKGGLKRLMTLLNGSDKGRRWDHSFGEAGHALANAILTRDNCLKSKHFDSSLGEEIIDHGSAIDVTSSESDITKTAFPFCSEFKYLDFKKETSKFLVSPSAENRVMTADLFAPVLSVADDHVGDDDDAGDGSSDMIAIGKAMSVGCTHLCHMSEQMRHLQMDRFLSDDRWNYDDDGCDGSSSSSSSSMMMMKPDIVCGDFNSLNRRDYTVSQWTSIEELRKKNDWEIPQSSFIDDMTGPLQFVDAFELFCQTRFWDDDEYMPSHIKSELFNNDFQQFIDKVNRAVMITDDESSTKKPQQSSVSMSLTPLTTMFKGMFKKGGSPPTKIEDDDEKKTDECNDADSSSSLSTTICPSSERKRSKLIQDLSVKLWEFSRKHWSDTCRFDTRIDYIFLHQTFLQSRDVHIEDFYVADTIESRLTDHKMVVLDLSLLL